MESITNYVIKDKHGHVIDQGSLSVVGTVNVAVDGGTGTPSADATYENGTLTITLHDIKGERGNGIASIVQTTESQESSGVNVVTITYDDGHIINLYIRNGAKGEQGETGRPGADRQPIESGDLIVAQSTGNSEEYVMSQKAVTDEFKADRLWEEVELSLNDFTTYPVCISQGAWIASSPTETRNNCYIIPINPGVKLRLIPQEGKDYWVEFLTSNSHVVGETPVYADSAIGSKSVEMEVTVPVGAKFMYIRNNQADVNILPYSIKVVTNTKPYIASMSSRVDDLEDESIYSKTVITDFSGYNTFSRYLDATDGWKTGSSNANCYLVNVPNGAKKVRVVYAEGHNGNIQFLETFKIDSVSPSGDSIPPHYMNGEFLPWIKGDNVFEVPAGTSVMYVRYKVGGFSYLPQKIIFYTPLKEKIEDVGLDNMSIGIRRNGIFPPTYQTFAPSHADTYNCILLDASYQNDIFQESARRLVYFPKAMVTGGTLSVTTTGLNAITVIELTWKDLQLNPCMANYTADDIISRSSIPATAGTYTVELNPKTRRIALLMGSTRNESTTPADIVNNITSVTLPLATLGQTTFAEDKALSLIKEAHYKYVAPGTTANAMLGLLHYSDIHASTIAAKEILAAIGRYKDYINAVVNTGDVAYINVDSGDAATDAKNGVQWWLDCGLAEKSLYVLGNHDVTKSDVGDKSQAWAFDNYFTPQLIARNGYVMPDGYNDPSSEHYKACYWHKDYAAQKVRIIGLDCMNHFDGIMNPTTGEITTAGVRQTTNGQEKWLIEKLQEVYSNSGEDVAGYSVIILSHYMLDDYDGDNAEWDDESHKWVCNQNEQGGRVVNYKTAEASNFHHYTANSYTTNVYFHWRNRTSSASPTKGDVNNVGEIIKAWMEDERYGNSQFIAFLHGHVHHDTFFYSKKYPNILNIGINQTGERRDPAFNDRDDVCMIANYIAIDTGNKYIKIVRVGNTSNIWLRPTTYMCYDYRNRIIISEG